jgi:hypothetical protein
MCVNQVAPTNCPALCATRPGQVAFWRSLKSPSLFLLALIAVCEPSSTELSYVTSVK